MLNKLATLELQPRWLIITLSGITTLILGLIDYLTGPYLSLIVFYLIPVFLITWYVGKFSGYFSCGFAAILWFFSDTLLVDFYPDRAVMYWNIIVRLIFFLVVVHVISLLQISLQHEKESSRRDYLTGALNSRAFYELMGYEFKRARRYHTPITVAYIDVDNFKTINDRFGHSVGDELLRRVVKTITHSIREIDAIARLGGDEFAIALPGASQELAQGILERILTSLTEAMRKQGWDTTCSIGVVTFTGLPESVDEMVKVVDGLMYQGKNGGKNMTHYATYPGTSNWPLL